MGRPRKAGSTGKKPKKTRGIAKAPTHREVVVAVKQRQALELRKSGMSYHDIAFQMGITKAWAGEMVRQAIHESVQEVADDIRAIEIARFDEMQKRAQDELSMYTADIKAFHESGFKAGRCMDPKMFVEIQDHMLRISRERRKLLGLDAAIEVKGSGTAILGLADLLKVQEVMGSNGCSTEDLCKTLNE
jgi:predicted transcriptional regulator